MSAIFAKRHVVFLLGIVLAGCVVTPPHDGLARVHVDDVVKRVKCDIGKAVFSKVRVRSPDGQYPFAFLQGWAAKLHLTIIVDDTASINPGATLVHALPSVGSTSQSYSTGIGVGVTTEAVRQEDIEFLMSFSDMNKDFNDPSKIPLYDYCHFDNGLLLESDLGLEAMVDAALAPIAAGVLRPGHNIGPGAAPPDTPRDQLKPPKALADYFNLKGQKGIVADLIQASEYKAVKALETRTQSIINNIVKPLYGIASSYSFDKKCLAQVAQNQNEAIVLSVNVSEDVVKYEEASTADEKTKAFNDEQDMFKKVVTAARDVIDSFKACATAAKKNQDKVYDPIDAINETVNFFITGTGSVTPTWKLVNVTAPLAPTFASATRKDTNTLILTMGRPLIADNGAVSASPTMNNQILASLLTQAINQQRVAP